MNSYLFFITAILVIDYIIDMVDWRLNMRALNVPLPAEFSDICSEEEYKKTVQYTTATSRFSVVQNTVSTVVTLLFIFAGGFNYIDTLARSFGCNDIGSGIIFAAFLLLFSWLLSLPFQIYSTFVIEERFGLNNTTLKTFILDTCKAAFLAALLGAPLFAFILWFFEIGGTIAWLYCWITVTLFTILLQFIAPVLIMPLFNKFTPIEEGEIKEAVSKYAKEQNFAIQGIYTMDGSKRSTKLNAFFTGFGRFRRIVFFDTLLEKLSKEELIAVLAHEMGHYKKRHTLFLMAASIIHSGWVFYLMSLFIGNEGLFAAFKMEHLSVYASLSFFGFLYSPVSMLISLLFNFFSRKCEYQADSFAAETTKGSAALISGLKKLGVSNLANLTPHAFHVLLHYSHPPLLMRIDTLRRFHDGTKK